MQELEQLDRIYTIMGTPTEEVWPGVSAMPNARGAARLPFHRGEQNVTPLQSRLGAEGGHCCVHSRKGCLWVCYCLPL